MIYGLLWYIFGFQTLGFKDKYVCNKSFMATTKYHDVNSSPLPSGHGGWYGGEYRYKVGLVNKISFILDSVPDHNLVDNGKHT